MTRLLLVLAVALSAHGYPLDGAARTGIRRLIGYQRMKLPVGAMRTSSQVRLRLRGANDSFELSPKTPRDSYLQGGVERIFGTRDASYGVALLDVSDPSHPAYASLRADEKKIPGSVGKLLVATGLFDAIARAHPEPAAREKLLRETVVTADSFVYRDGKTVPFFREGDPAVTNRRIEAGDKFSLWEWADHMLSQSSNAAGSTVWKQAMLILRFGAR